MPRAYPPEFRALTIALIRAGKPQNQTAHELDIHPVTLSKWVKQDKIDRGEMPGVSSSESATASDQGIAISKPERPAGAVPSGLTTAADAKNDSAG